MDDVEETFKTLEKVRMKLNPVKCTFGVEECQFLGYYITKKGIQPSPTKVNEFMEVPSPNTLRDAQGLNSKLIAVSRFISKSAKKALPLFHTLKCCIIENNFQWTVTIEVALQQIKETMQVSLSASDEAISSVLVVEREGRQVLVYFC